MNMYPKILTMNCGLTVFVSCDYTGNNTKALDLDFLVVQETESGGRSGGKLSSRSGSDHWMLTNAIHEKNAQH